jgi:hypothetical protein
VDGRIDERNLVDGLARRGAMSEEEPVGAMERAL